MRRLSHLNVLILDCQATGANPKTGHLLEIGWRHYSAAAKKGPQPQGETFLVRLPKKAVIPERVQRITGITPTDLETACSMGRTFIRMAAAVRRTAALNGGGACPLISHYARFEGPFVRRLYRYAAPSGEFPFQVVCTHEIALRLLPDLPRLGLRAVAGYLGLSVPEKRRCADHVAATAFIWNHFTRMLCERGVSTLDDLTRWMAETPRVARRGRRFPMAAHRRKSLPDRPGVYRMQRSNGDILYVGKATSLKKRVNSYFHRGRRHGEHILEMLAQAAGLEITVTPSALEAALLESDEIKRLSPPYNQALRKRERNIGFCSRDLRSFRKRADARHCAGPLPSERSIRPLMSIAAFLHPTAAEDPAAASRRIPAALGVPASRAPDVDCFIEGLRRFRRRHVDLLGQPKGHRALAAVGIRLWRIHQAAEDTAAPTMDRGTEEEDDASAGEDGDAWHPETVADALDAAVRHGTRLLRRGRWFCFLSESRLSWRRRNDTGRHRLFVSGGECRATPPQPATGRGPLVGRMPCFDVSVYDRLRVVTTELRRLVSEARDPRLQLGRKTFLDGSKLSKLLRWV